MIIWNGERADAGVSIFLLNFHQHPPANKNKGKTVYMVWLNTYWISTFFGTICYEQMEY